MTQAAREAEASLARYVATISLRRLEEYEGNNDNNSTEVQNQPINGQLEGSRTGVIGAEDPSASLLPRVIRVAVLGSVDAVSSATGKISYKLKVRMLPTPRLCFESRLAPSSRWTPDAGR